MSNKTKLPLKSVKGRKAPKPTKAKTNKAPRAPSQTTKVTAPVASGFVRKVREPRFTRSMKNGDVVIDHEEFIREVNGSTTFTNTAIPINPGLLTSFPWLAQMAPLYESYRFEKLDFVYQPEAPTSTPGSVMLAVDYDATDPPATAKVQLATYRGYIRSPPWQSCTNSSIKEDLNKQKSFFVRSGSLSANSDLKLYDVGFLNIATSNQTDTSVIGELYIRYRVRLMTPQFQDDGLGLARSGEVSGTTNTSVPTLTGNAPLVLTGTTQAFTLTAGGPYQALISYRALGTGLVSLSTAGSTATIGTPFAVVNAGATNYSYTAALKFAAGQTFVATLTNSTTSSVVGEISQFDNTLA